MQYKQPIILFDGVCNLCNGFVQFILNKEQTSVITFAALQSEIGIELLKQYKLPIEQTPSSIIFIENSHAYTESSAILRIAKHLKGAWSLAAYLIIIPKPIRDFIYRVIGKNRYLLFGKSDACWLPTPELQKRFLT